MKKKTTTKFKKSNKKRSIVGLAKAFSDVARR